jgi:acyl-CoA synthetase (AMP-forming)/AMP-acid ligase II
MHSTVTLPETLRTIPEALTFWARQTPLAPALRGVDGRELSHVELQQSICGIAAHLVSMEIHPDERVAVILSPGLDQARALLGVMTVAAAVPLDPRATPDELTRDLRRLPPRLVVTAHSSDATTREIAQTLGLPIVTLDELKRPQPVGARRDVLPIRRPEDIATILHTSGTTGYPKRVPLPHRAFVAGSRAVCARLGLTPDDVALPTAGLHTISGIGNMVSALASGGSCLVPSSFDASAWRQWLRDPRATWMITTPSELDLALDAVPANSGTAGTAGSRLRLIMAGGQAMPMATAARAERCLGARVLERFGMSEAMYIAWSGPSPSEQRAGSCGRPLAAEIRILDDDGREISPGSVGEIVIRGPTLFPGYLDDPAANAAAFLPDGWFHTGDIGRVDEEGFLYLTGRLKEQINRGGEKIAPTEVDRVLAQHPAVAAAAAFAVSDARLGEDIVAAVVLRPGMTASQRELRHWMLDRLSAFKTPRRIWFVDDLPRTGTGKVQRGELARRWHEAQG